MKQIKQSVQGEVHNKRLYANETTIRTNMNYVCLHTHTDFIVCVCGCFERLLLYYTRLILTEILWVHNCAFMQYLI